LCNVTRGLLARSLEEAWKPEFTTVLGRGHDREPLEQAMERRRVLRARVNAAGGHGGPLGEIAALGSSEASASTCAFRCWSGQSPTTAASVRSDPNCQEIVPTDQARWCGWPRLIPNKQGNRQPIPSSFGDPREAHGCRGCTRERCNAVHPQSRPAAIKPRPQPVR
jgi:hypothetical protein